ncbi:MAG: DNA mismatch repair endonuclease MutL [Clostridia bacterium]|nr:DNA mismatch repair endonuclease MutL [Clostridia bacterium]
MGIINVLDIEVANLIAAGEVVERPANAVKELVENAIDAGADSVSVEIIGGGIRSMRVTDNGCGMSAEDAVVAVRRHATSKLRKAEDLSEILTLGFRGEALAAITAVSKFRLMTKRCEDTEGTVLSGEYGKVTEVSSAGCPDGTTIVCEKLFSATPARLKFLKSEASEASAVAGALEKLALSHPEISFRFLSDGNLKFSTSGDGNLKNTIYSLYGAAFAKNLAEIHASHGGVTVSGFVSTPEHLRGNRGMQHFFINERCVRSKTLTSALEAAFRSYIPSGKFPSCVLHIAVSASLVDVNIHPAKLEVKFSDEKAVFDAVFSSVRHALSVGISHPSLNLAEISEKTEEREKLKNLFLEAEEKGSQSELPKSMEKIEKREELSLTEEKPSQRTSPSLLVLEVPKAPPSQPQPQKTPIFDDDDLPVDVPVLPSKPKEPFLKLNAENSTDNFGYMSRLYASAVKTANVFSENESENTVVSEETDAKIPEMPTNPIPEYQLIGEAFAGYIIVESGEKLFLIDKHAAHERINFERLRANMQTKTPNIQMLLFPEKLMVSEQEIAVCTEYQKELEACGFEFAWKEKEISVLGIPAGFEKAQARTLFLTLLSETAESGEPLESARQSIFEKALYQSACKASVKAGKLYDTAHLRWICDNLFRYDCIKYCPHGRPVAFEIGKKELDTHFGRT